MAENETVEAERMIIIRVFDAPLEVVWKAWTDPQYVMQWWGPKDFTTPVCRIDFRVGGKFLYCMKSPDGQEFWTGGEYHEIVPHENIVLSMYFSNPAGEKVEPEQYGIKHEAIDGAYDSILFEDLGDGRTKLTYTGNETMQQAMESGQVEGMNQSLDKLATAVHGVVHKK